MKTKKLLTGLVILNIGTLIAKSLTFINTSTTDMQLKGFLKSLPLKNNLIGVENWFVALIIILATTGTYLSMLEKNSKVR